MARYEIPDDVRNNIITILNNANIKGSEAIEIVKIRTCLNKPIEEKKDVSVINK